MDKETFESQNSHLFGELFRDFIYYEYLRSGLKQGKSSKFLLGTSKILLMINEKDKAYIELMKSLDRNIKERAREMLELMKIMNPEVFQR
jgi:hypothetical protein